MMGRLDGVSFENKIKANIFNNQIRNEFKESIKSDNLTIKKLPEIIIEIYFNIEEEDDTCQALTMKQKEGNNNQLRETSTGIQMKLSYDLNFSETIQKLIENKFINDIPIEYYSAKWTFFNADIIKSFRQIPLKIALIDTTKREYGTYMNRYINKSMMEYLTEEEHKSLSLSYHNLRTDFTNTDEIIDLNKKIETYKISEHKVEFIASEPERNEWKDDISISVDNIPFENLGFGFQNLIKLGLAVKEKAEKFGIILFEEPENNLSFSNMSKLIATIKATDNQQKFITTHSSYVANKLNLSNLILLNNGVPAIFKSISNDTIDYFIKLPGYNTLRMFLAKKSILVEGPSDELIIQRSYLDSYSKLPIEEGIDVISVRALAFKRYLELAIIAKTKTVVVTDNDGDIQKLKARYSDYLDYIFYEKNSSLKTLEPSIVEVNFKSETDTVNFISIIKEKQISEIRQMILSQYEGWNDPKLKNYIIKWMTTPINKTKWSLRVFSSTKKIKYPEYIIDAIKK